MVVLIIVFIFLDVIFILLLKKLYNDLLTKLKESGLYIGYFLLEKRPSFARLLLHSKHMLKNFNIKKIKSLFIIYMFFIIVFTVLALVTFITYLFI